MSARRKPRLVAERAETPPIRLRIGIGSEEGFTNVEHLLGIEPSTVDALYSAFHFHRLDQMGRFIFMNDAYRILKPGSQLMLVAPYWSSMRSIGDPLAMWPPLAETSFSVYLKEFRDQEGLTDMELTKRGLPPLTCNLRAACGYGGHPHLAVRNEEFVAYAKEHEVNWIHDLHVTLTKEPIK